MRRFVENYQIPKGSEAVLPTSFISIGDREVDIVPPVDAEKVGMLKPGDTINGRLASALDNLVPNSQKTIEELNKTLVAFRELLQDEKLKGGMTSLMATTEKTVKNFGDLADRMDSMLAQNSNTFDDLLTTTAVSLKNLEAVSTDIKKLVESGELQDKTVALLDNLNKTVESGHELVDQLNAVVADPKMRSAIDETLQNVKTMSESGTRIADNAEVMAQNGVVVSDEAVKLIRKVNDLADQVQSLLGDFKKTVEKLQAGGSSFTNDVQFDANLTRETDPGRTRSDINMTVPWGNERLTVGLYDAFESNKLNLQFGRDMTNYLGLRYGVYASKPAVGVDYSFASRFNLRGDLFGLNEPQLDLKLGYKFGNGINAYFGVERLFEKPMAVAGVGIKK